MLTHIDDTQKVAMVDVSEKKSTKRTATAEAVVILPEAIIKKLKENNFQVAKGNIEQIAIVAGIMGAKKTSELIPLCHPIPLENCKLNMNWNQANELLIQCTTTTTAKTGVEMEAISGASIAALTIYDMCKAMSQDIVISNIRLLSKNGGKKDFERAG